ncbi:MAG: hypothetical protein HQL53_02350 [Magnetococcales bacterium]|nr:hypothetical protein [Magnetococcales bacterium]
MFKQLLMGVNARNRTSVTPLQLTLFALLFALSTGGSCYYVSNQNAYFIHGLKLAGDNFLAGDWLASLPSPLPVFDQILRLLYITMGEKGFLVGYVFSMGVLGFGLMAISLRTFPLHRSVVQLGLFLVGLQFIFSALFSKLLIMATVTSKGQLLFTSGMAWQRLTTTGFEPASFGVGLVVALYLFISHRVYAAVFVTLLTCTLHTGLLLTSSLTVAAFLWILWREKGWSWRRLIGLMLFAALFIAPVVIYVVINFGGESAEITQRARAFLAFKYIPYHVDARYWVSWETAWYLFLMTTATYLVGRGTLRSFFLMLLLLGGGLSVVQYITRDPLLGLMFPWRASSYLVPLSSALILAWIVDRLPQMAPGLFKKSRRRAMLGVLLVFSMLLVGSGLYRMQSAVQQGEQGPDVDLMRHIRQHRTALDHYLVPQTQPMDRLRLYAGVPVYVNAKSHPFGNQAVLTWWDRGERVKAFYGQLPAGGCFSPEEVQEAFGVTHVVVETEKRLQCPKRCESYRNTDYVLYALAQCVGSGEPVNR